MSHRIAPTLSERASLSARSCLLLCSLALAGPTAVLGTETITVIPRPVTVKERRGTFELRADTVILSGPDSRAAATALAASLAPATGFDLEMADGIPLRLRRELGLCGRGARNTSACRTWIHLQTTRRFRRRGDAFYLIRVGPGGIRIRARTATGFFYAAQTLRQLLPHEIFSSTPVGGVAWTIPTVHIKDYPRFSWRGAMLDVSRHFMPPEFVKRFLDLMALHKLNRFHWHLSDDQGWRVEIRTYPRLTEIGSRRTETPLRLLPHAGLLNLFLSTGSDGVPHDGFYTQDDIRGIVAYAGQRHISVVPEVDMPGHIQAAIAAHPELGNTGEPVSVATRFGPQTHILNAEEETFGFLEDVLREVMELFGSEFIHLGGDEVVFTEWEQSAAVQARIAELGLTDERELLAYFINRMAAFLRSHGRRYIGWDNGLYTARLLDPDLALMSWLGQDNGVAEARRARDVVMTPLLATYFDHPSLPLPPDEQTVLESTLGADHPLLSLLSTDLEEAYGFDPVPDGFPEDKVGHILGIQGQIWTEYIHDGNEVEMFAFPRLMGLAETAWTPPALKDFRDFEIRLETHLLRLRQLGVNFRSRGEP